MKNWKTKGDIDLFKRLMYYRPLQKEPINRFLHTTHTNKHESYTPFGLPYRVSALPWQTISKTSNNSDNLLNVSEMSLNCCEICSDVNEIKQIK